MAEIFFFFTWSLSISTVLLKRRYFDLFTLAIVIGTYYASPLFFGTLYDPTLRIVVDIIDRLYWFYGLFFLFLYVAMRYSDFKRIRPIEDFPNATESNSLILFSLLPVFLFCVLIFLDPNFFIPSEIGESNPSEFGPIYPLFIWSTMILLVFALKFRNKKFLLVSLFLVLATLLAGSRAVFATSILFSVMISAWNLGRMRILFHPRYIIGGIFGFLFLFFYKIGYGALIQMDIQLVVNNITDIAIISSRFFQGGESFLVMLNLQNTFIYMDMESVFISDALIRDHYHQVFMIKLIPLLSEYYAEIFNISLYRFSDILHDKFYPDVFYGLASTFWGEAIYVLGIGFAGAIVILLIYVLFLYLGNKLIFSNNIFANSLTPVLVYCSFYLGRKEIADVVYILTISLFILILNQILIRVFR